MILTHLPEKSSRMSAITTTNTNSSATIAASVNPYALFEHMEETVVGGEAPTIWDKRAGKSARPVEIVRTLNESADVKGPSKPIRSKRPIPTAVIEADPNKVCTAPCRNMRRNGDEIIVCTRAHCTFAHSLEKLVARPCNYGDKCNRRGSNCRFFHPSDDRVEFFSRLFDISNLPEKEPANAPKGAIKPAVKAVAKVATNVYASGPVVPWTGPKRVEVPVAPAPVPPPALVLRANLDTIQAITDSAVQLQTQDVPVKILLATMAGDLPTAIEVVAQLAENGLEVVIEMVNE